MSIMVFCAPAVAGKRHLPMRRAFWYAGALPPRNHFGSVDMCGRGGTGRRAALRSLWEKSRGSSSLLDRTSLRSRSEGRLPRRSPKGEVGLLPLRELRRGWPRHSSIETSALVKVGRVALSWHSLHFLFIEHVCILHSPTPWAVLRITKVLTIRYALAITVWNTIFCLLCEVSSGDGFTRRSLWRKFLGSKLTARGFLLRC